MSRSRRPLALPLLVALLALALPSEPAQAQGVRPADAWPADTDIDPSVPAPVDVLGWEPGRWHIRPGQLQRYVEVLAAASPRVELVETGRTHEGRPLLLAAVSSPANLVRLEELRVLHRSRVLAGEPPEEGAPLIVWLGYSVHGDEPSGANAAAPLLHVLAADRSERMGRWLDEMIVLVDPMLNPDGLARFATWANMHQGQVRVKSADHREHRQAWPTGRTNHYWFDLNRDWVPLVHPESRARVAQFHRWMPNVLTDHHEMGTRSTFFFQPGVPSRSNPNTPERNLELTRALATHHARALDAAGELYYTEESFDDYYYGKGSTYPDVHGAVGILFEQASSRGHLQENDSGELSFERTIRNQLLTSFSTLEGAHANKDALLRWQAEFYAGAAEEVRGDGLGGWLFGAPEDPARNAALVDVLLRHDIVVTPLEANRRIDGTEFRAGHAFAVPVKQPQARLARALFERPLEFRDATFYDVSAWTLPLAFGLPFVELAPAEFADLDRGDPLRAAPGYAADAEVALDRPGVGWAIPWGGLHAPRALTRLLSADVRVRVATRGLTARTAAGSRDMAPGTLVIPRGQPEVGQPELLALLATIREQDGLPVHVMLSALTPDGVDLGSPSLPPLAPRRVAILVDGGTSSYEAGALWHEVDLRWRHPALLLEVDDLSSSRLAELDVVLAPGGALASLDDGQPDALKDWVDAGGVLVAQRSSATWVGRQWYDWESGPDPEDGNGEDEAATTGDVPGEGSPAYADYEALRAKGLVSGVFLESSIDATHPLGFGYADGRLVSFRSGTHWLDAGEDPFAAAATYTDAPLLAGYGGPRALEKLAGSGAVLAKRRGRGTVVLLADDPVFRGFLHGSARVLANAVFFGKIIKRTGKLDAPDDESALELDDH